MRYSAEQLQTTVLCKGDVFVSKGQHLDNLWILRTGSVTIAEYTTARKNASRPLRRSLLNAIGSYLVTLSRR